MVVSTPSELVCFIPYLSMCSVLVLLNMNLDGFSGDLNTTIGSLSINQKFLSIVEEFVKRILYVFDGGMSRYYLVFILRTYVFSLYIIRMYRCFLFSLRVLSS